MADAMCWWFFGWVQEISRVVPCQRTRAVPAGTAVWTVAPGTVYAVGRRPGYGLVVQIDHPGGIRGSEPVRTRYVDVNAARVR